MDPVVSDGSIFFAGSALIPNRFDNQGNYGSQANGDPLPPPTKLGEGNIVAGGTATIIAT